MADDSKINSSSVLFSQVVKNADPTDEEKPTYEFGNGRKFVEPKPQ
jgi:hypothetical protein